MSEFKKIREEFMEKARKLIAAGDPMDFWESVVFEMGYEIFDLREKLKDQK